MSKQTMELLNKKAQVYARSLTTQLKNRSPLNIPFIIDAELTSGYDDSTGWISSRNGFGKDERYNPVEEIRKDETEWGIFVRISVGNLFDQLPLEDTKADIMEIVCPWVLKHTGLEIKDVVIPNSQKQVEPRKIFVFGDSYSDCGNYPLSEFPLRETVWAQHLNALQTGKAADKDISSSAGGNNYAFGEARLIKDVSTGSITSPSIFSQIQSAGDFQQDDIVCFYGGASDFIAAEMATSNANYIFENYEKCVQEIYNKGARNIILLNMLDFYKMPDISDLGQTTPSATQVAATINGKILLLKNKTITGGSLEGANLYIYDFYNELNDMLEQGVPGIEGGSVPTVWEKFFIDGIHLKSQVHYEIASKIYKDFVKPLKALDGAGMTIEQLVQDCANFAKFKGSRYEE
tara:strand:+ start:2717 stop:3931 length:1215 start_codon:yes stop_codon:yes gene_type:complete